MIMCGSTAKSILCGAMLILALALFAQSKSRAEVPWSNVTVEDKARLPYLQIALNIFRSRPKERRILDALAVDSLTSLFNNHPDCCRVGPNIQMDHVWAVDIKLPNPIEADKSKCTIHMGVIMEETSWKAYFGFYGVLHVDSNTKCQPKPTTP